MEEEPVELKEELETVEHPLMNTLILSSIFSILRIRELKFCRLVCQTWREVSTPFLQRGSVVKLTFRGAKSSGSKSVQAKQLKYLTKFYDFLIKSQRNSQPLLSFPNLSLCNWEYSSRVWQNFSLNYRNSLSSLSLDRFHSDCAVILQCVYDHFPNLSHLKVVCDRDFQYRLWNQHKLPAMIPIPDDPVPLKLKTFSFIHCPGDQGSDMNWALFWKIFPNIQTLNLHVHIAELCTSLDELCKLKSYTNLQQLTLRPCIYTELNPNNLEGLLKNLILLAGPQLKDVGLAFNFSNEQWKNILQGTSDNLRSLSVSTHWIKFENYPPPPPLPPSNGQSVYDYLLSPFGYTMVKSQELRSLSLTITGWINIPLRHCTPSTLCFPNVTCLNWNIRMDSTEQIFPTLISDFRKIFPNLKRLQMPIKTASQFRNIVTHLSHLEELVVCSYGYRNCQLMDCDFIGDGRPWHRPYAGIKNMTELRCLSLGTDNRKLTGECILQGILKLVKIQALKIKQTRGFPQFDDIVKYKLREKSCKLTLCPFETNQTA